MSAMRKYLIVLLCVVLCSCTNAPADVFQGNAQEQLIGKDGFEFSGCPWGSSLEDVTQKIGLSEKYYSAAEVKNSGSVLNYYANPPKKGSGADVKRVPIQYEGLGLNAESIGFVFQDDGLIVVTLTKSYDTWDAMKGDIAPVQQTVLGWAMPAGTKELVWAEKLGEGEPIINRGTQVPLAEMTSKIIQEEGTKEFIFRADDDTFLILCFWYTGEGPDKQRFIRLIIASGPEMLSDRFVTGQISRYQEVE